MTTAATIPLAGDAVPVLGHALPLLRDPLAFLSSLPDHGDLVRLRLGPLSLVMVCDPVLTRHVLRDDRTFDMGGPIMDRARELADGVGTCPRERHRRQRRLCQPAFHRGRMPAYGGVMAASCAEVAASWRDGQEIDITDEMGALILRIVATTMFSSASPELTRSISEDFKAISGPVFWRIVMPPRFRGLPTPGNRRYRRAHARLRRTVADMIDAHRAAGADRGDLLSSLLTARDPDSEVERTALTDEEVINQVINFFTGADATGPAMAWALCLVAAHPDIERRLADEVDEVLDGGPPSWHHLPRLRLAERVMTEALRLYTPTWFGSRVVTEDTDLGGHRLPAGTMIGWSPYVIHRLPQLYKEPERFDPDRWLDADVGHEAYFPFGGGARKCIGQRFALSTAVLTLAAITSRWTLRPVDGGPIRPVAKVLLAPHGTRMRAVAR
ncbi:cytochrome P450 [Streptomyces sp. PT12]|uniref:cytochrome P450 n=1 Tax=Streptomyces sp. PT12 TaxID=1510197 RepID=UPI001C672849|nr:cytochrome P450 [Streptomyces sp. PT12]